MMNISKLSRSAVKLVIVAALCTVGSLDAGTAQAAGTATANLAVSASVAANCTISTSALAFGAYDPISANQSSPLLGTGGVTVVCTTGSTVNVTLDQGQSPASASSNSAPLRQMSDGAADLLAYVLYQDSAHNTPWGNTSGTGPSPVGTGAAQSLVVYGSVAAGQNVPAGTYTDTVTATVTF
jgi:spore coat protein U-like protein